MKQILIFSFVLLVTGCTNTIQTASISEAYKKYETQDYEDTLELIRLAENAKETTPEIKAELTYLKAQSYEKLGQLEKAATLFEYLKEQHAGSQYGYLAIKKLETKL